MLPPWADEAPEPGDVKAVSFLLPSTSKSFPAYRAWPERPHNERMLAVAGDRPGGQSPAGCWPRTEQPGDAELSRGVTPRGPLAASGPSPAS